MIASSIKLMLGACIFEHSNTDILCICIYTVFTYNPPIVWRMRCKLIWSFAFSVNNGGQKSEDGHTYSILYTYR